MYQEDNKAKHNEQRRKNNEIGIMSYTITINIIGRKHGGHGEHGNYSDRGEKK